MATNPDYPLRLAREKAGGPAKLAAYLGVSPAAVSQWPRVPIHHVDAVSKLLRRSKEFVRPDLFGSGNGKASTAS